MSKEETVDELCSKCSNTKHVVPIRYGMPGPEMMLEYDMGKIKLGGCGIVENAPKWYCHKCEHEFIDAWASIHRCRIYS